jgi:alpha-1,2-mannosyltransferase
VRTLWTIIRDGSWLTAERLRVYSAMLITAYAASVIWLVTTATGVIDSVGRPLGTDFTNIWSSGRLVLEGRAAIAFDPELQRPYQQALLGMSPDLFYGWHYPPMFLAIAALLALMPYLMALIVWLLIFGITYVRTIKRIMPVAHNETATVILLALASPAVYANITHGHNGFLSATLIGLGLVYLRTQPIAAGVLFGLLAYKPQYGLLLPFALAAGGHWRTIIAAAITVAATALASVVLFGTDSWAAFFTHSAFTREVILEGGAAGWFKLQGVFPAVRMWGGSITQAYAAQAAAIVALIALTIWLWRQPASDALKAAGLILATMLATPYAFNYDMVILSPAIAFMVADARDRSFAPFEISVLALLWVTPLFSRELAALANLPVALITTALALALLVDIVRTRSPRMAPVGRPAHV